MKSINLQFKCESCNQSFIVSSHTMAPNVVNNKKEFMVDGQSVFLTYCDCPHCGYRHFVQIDDTTSLKMLEDVTAQFVKLSAAQKAGKKIPKKQSDNFKKARQHLSDYRKNLVEMYTGKVAVSEIGIECELRFVGL